MIDKLNKIISLEDHRAKLHSPDSEKISIYEYMNQYMNHCLFIHESISLSEKNYTE